MKIKIALCLFSFLLSTHASIIASSPKDSELQDIENFNESLYEQKVSGIKGYDASIKIGNVSLTDSYKVSSDGQDATLTAKSFQAKALEVEHIYETKNARGDVKGELLTAEASLGLSKDKGLHANLGADLAKVGGSAVLGKDNGFLVEGELVAGANGKIDGGFIEKGDKQCFKVGIGAAFIGGAYLGLGYCWKKKL